MDFESITLKTPHKQRIIIEIDILGDEVNLDNYQNIADRLTDLLCQDSWLANPPEKLTFNTKVSLQLLPNRTHDREHLTFAISINTYCNKSGISGLLAKIGSSN